MAFDYPLQHFIYIWWVGWLYIIIIIIWIWPTNFQKTLHSGNSFSSVLMSCGFALYVCNFFFLVELLLQSLVDRAYTFFVIFFFKGTLCIYLVNGDPYSRGLFFGSNILTRAKLRIDATMFWARLALSFWPLGLWLFDTQKRISKLHQ